MTSFYGGGAVIINAGGGPGGGTSDYNELTNIPIVNLNGTTTPIILSNLNENGIYKLTGFYKVTESDAGSYNIGTSILTINTVENKKQYYFYDPNQQRNTIITIAEDGTYEMRSLPSGVKVDTTENWNNNVSYIPEKGAVIVYSDYKTVNDKLVPGVKIGDGNAFLIDLPFITDGLDIVLESHVGNEEIHITPEERANWNNKVSCAMDSSNKELLILTTDN